MIVNFFWIITFLTHCLTITTSTGNYGLQTFGSASPFVQDLSSLAFQQNPVPYRHDKRQVELRTGRSALIIYHCPLSGQQFRLFKWEARYQEEVGRINLYSLHNIDAWDDILVVTNDFSTHFYARHAEVHQGLCCLYSFKAQVVGAVYNDYIALQITRTPEHHQEAIKISEFCVHVPADLTCAVAGNPIVGHLRTDCALVGVIMGDA